MENDVNKVSINSSLDRLLPSHHATNVSNKEEQATISSNNNNNKQEDGNSSTAVNTGGSTSSVSRSTRALLPVAKMETVFRSSYMRNHKSLTVKNLRCFPECSEVHRDNGFCGNSVFVNYQCARNPRDSSPPQVTSVAQFMMQTEPNYFEVNFIYTASQLMVQPSSNFCECSSTHLVSTTADAYEYRVEFVRGGKGWHYGWMAGRGVNSEALHEMRVYIFEPFTPDGEFPLITGIQAVDKFFVCRAIVKSGGFQIRSRKRLRKSSSSSNIKSSLSDETNATNKPADEEKAKAKNDNDDTINIPPQQQQRSTSTSSSSSNNNNNNRAERKKQKNGEAVTAPPPAMHPHHQLFHNPHHPHSQSNGGSKYSSPKEYIMSHLKSPQVIPPLFSPQQQYGALGTSPDLNSIMAFPFTTSPGFFPPMSGSTPSFLFDTRMNVAPLNINKYPLVFQPQIQQRQQQQQAGIGEQQQQQQQQAGAAAPPPSSLVSGNVSPPDMARMAGLSPTSFLTRRLINGNASASIFPSVVGSSSNNFGAAPPGGGGGGGGGAPSFFLPSFLMEQQQQQQQQNFNNI